MTTIASAALALAMIAALILLIGGVKLVGKDRQRGRDHQQAALVLVGNVLIWTI